MGLQGYVPCLQYVSGICWPTIFFSPFYTSALLQQGMGWVCVFVCALVFCLCVSACVCACACVSVSVMHVCICGCACVCVLVCGVWIACVCKASFCIFHFSFIPWHSENLVVTFPCFCLEKYLLLFDQFVHHACCMGILLSLGSGLWCCHGTVMVHGK